MKILVLCAYGQNRSRYVARYLKDKGYEADFDGVMKENDDLVQAKIDDASVIITVSKDVHARLVHNFNLNDKRVIEIDVDDRPGVVLENNCQLSGGDWINFQEKFVYPKLVEQLDKFLPIKG